MQQTNQKETAVKMNIHDGYVEQDHRMRMEQYTDMCRVPFKAKIAP